MHTVATHSEETTRLCLIKLLICTQEVGFQAKEAPKPLEAHFLRDDPLGGAEKGLRRRPGAKNQQHTWDKKIDVPRTMHPINAPCISTGPVTVMCAKCASVASAPSL